MEYWYYIQDTRLADAIAALKVLDINYLYEDAFHWHVVLFLYAVTLSEKQQKLLNLYGFIRNEPPDGLIKQPSSGRV